MSTRVLTTIKENNQLVGFRVIGTTPKPFMSAVGLAYAEQLYLREPFENVELNNHRWRGLECSLDRLPVQDVHGNYLKRDAEIIVLRRKIDENNTTVGFEFMNLNGIITEHTVEQALSLAKQYKLINADVVEDKFIRANRGSLKVKKVKLQPITPPTLNDLVQKDSKLGTVMSGATNTYMGQNLGVTPKEDTKPNTEAVKDKEIIKPMKDELLRKQKELNDLLAEASRVYYLEDREIMSNYDYDKKEKELLELENQTGVVFANSVTHNLGGSYDFEAVSKLPKIKHPSPMLSLDKTKDRDSLGNLLGAEVGFLGWKLDGLTCVLTYDNGELESAVTRGNGTTGEDITHNAVAFTNVPKKIAYTDRLVLRGEAMISYSTFEEINSKITVEADKYKNPRNLASGTVRQLDPKIAKARKPVFVVFGVVEGFDELNSKVGKLEKAAELGFEVVEYVMVHKNEVVDAISEFEKRVDKIPYPTDGLVLSIDDIAYGNMLGMTGKFPRDSKAFKWKDEEKETTLVEIDWSCSRTGAINPVAVFKPVDLEGTTVTRASLSNVSIFESFELGVGDTLSVFKANMIIPQVAENLTRSNTLKIPTSCPVCGGLVAVEKNLDTKVLYCKNPDCSAKKVGALAHYVQRDAANMDGIAESTLEKLMSEGIVKTYKDLYHLEEKKDAIFALDGVKTGIFNKWLKAVEQGRHMTLDAFIYGLGVEQFGRTASKAICKAFDYDLEKVLNATKDDLITIDGVGNIMADAFLEFFGKDENKDLVRDLATEVTFEAPKVITVTQSAFTGKNVIATGTLVNFDRKAIKEKFESLGAKVVSSISAKLDYALIGDSAGPSKLEKIKELNAKGAHIQEITEAEFLAMINE